MTNPRRDRGTRLRALASAAYTASAGHLEIDPEEPEAPARRRWLPGVRSALIAGAVVLALGTAVALAAWWTAPAAPEPLPTDVAATAPGGADESVSPEAAEEANDEPDESPTAPGEGTTSTSPPADGDDETVVVHVAGAVTEPGVVELDAGSRVADAVERAGGATSEADLGTVNLARVLADGEQVYVPAVGEEPPPAAGPPPSGSADGAGGGGSQAPVDLNTAGAAELEELPGIGPALATAILEWRDTNGGFASVEDLDLVSGIGPATLERLRPLVTV